MVATLAVIAVRSLSPVLRNADRQTLISLFRQRRRSSTFADHSQKSPSFSIDVEQGAIFAQLEDKFLKIACLISLYPIALILVNGIITAGDLYISAAEGVLSKPVYALYCIYYFLYGGRGIVFAILGIFVDPCLRRVSRSIFRAYG